MSFDSLTRGIKGALAETIYTQVIPEELPQGMRTDRITRKKDAEENDWPHPHHRGGLEAAHPPG
jgi:hypothetical protein